MQTDPETSSFLDGAEPQRSRTSKLGLKLGVALVALSSIGVLGVRYGGVTTTIAPFQALHFARTNVIEKFVARALSESDFSMTAEAVLKQKGAPDPSKMTYNFVLKQGKTSGAWPATIFTFKSKSGKSDVLVKALQKVVDGLVKLECKGGSKSCKDKFSALATVTKTDYSVHHGGKGDFVVLQLKEEHGPAQEDEQDDLAAAIKAHDPRLLAEVNFGRTLTEMLDNKNDNIAVIAQGIHLKIGTAFASTAFDVLGEMVPGMGPYSKILKGLSSVSSREDIIYKNDKDLGDSFGKIPSLSESGEFQDLKNTVKHAPKDITEPLAELVKSSAGLAGITVSGLPSKYELVVSLKGVRVGKLVKYLLD